VARDTIDAVDGDPTIFGIEPTSAQRGDHGALARALLSDFGFARSGVALASLSGGTIAYMASEQLRAFVESRHSAAIGPAADVYALGLTLVELLLGRLPRIPDAAVPPRIAALELLKERSQADWIATAGLDHVPRPLHETLRRCLAPYPEARYADAGALASDLERTRSLVLNSAAGWKSERSKRFKQFGASAKVGRRPRFTAVDSLRRGLVREETQVKCAMG
jgi:serine/threonine protein kinase